MKKKVILIVIVVLILVFMPLIFLRNAEFSGSDDAGSQMIEKVDPDYQPWDKPILEKIIGRELPGEVETLLFCVQTGIGVGVVAFLMGRLVERRKWMLREDGKTKQDSQRKMSDVQVGKEQ